MNALVSLFLATALLLGGGATAVAAQDDLPNQPLYPVKLWTENTTLALTGNPQEQANLLMNMAQTRVEEMAALAEQGIAAPKQVGDRLQLQIQQTMMLAANMDDATLNQTLLQLREKLQTQDRLMEQLQKHATAETEPLLTQTRLMLQTHLQLVNEGVADPQGFRYLMTNQMQYGLDENLTPGPNQQGEPGFHQNDQDEQPPAEAGNGDDNGQGNDTPGGQNTENSQNGSGGDGPGNEIHGDPDSDSGSCSGCDGGNDGGGNCSGSDCGGGGNK